MKTTTFIPLTRRVLLLFFLILSSLMISENAFSIKSWGGHCCYVYYNNAGLFAPEDNITFYFKFFDYNFGPALENGYMENFDATYSSDYGATFNPLFSASTKDQKKAGWSWIIMKNKMVGADLFFCTHPHSPQFSQFTPWQDITEPRLEIDNHYAFYNQTWIYLKWVLRSTYLNVTHIRVKGKWHVNGIWCSQFFEITYALKNPNLPQQLKLSNPKDTSSYLIEGAPNASNVNAVKVSKETDEIVIQGAEQGENIQVYSTSGALLKSSVASDDVTKIKLPANKMYIVNVGKARFKVAMCVP